MTELQQTSARYHDPSLGRIAGAGTLVKTVLVSLTVTAALLAALLLLVNRAEWWRGFLGAAVVSALATAGSLLSLLLTWRRELNARVAAHFLAAAVRAVVSIGGCLLAIRAGGYPKVPTMLLMVAFYFALLASETTLVARSLWNAKA